MHSSNFIDLRNNKPVLPPYKNITFANKKVDFVGCTTPRSFTKSTLAYFKIRMQLYLYIFICSI